MIISLPQTSIKKLSFCELNSLQPIIKCYTCFLRPTSNSYLCKTRLFKKGVSEEWFKKDGIFYLRDDDELRWKKKKTNKKRVVLIRFREGFGLDGGGGSGGGGGGGKDDGSTGRVLVNLALAIGLTYLSMTGQLGWVLDAIVSVWLLAVLLPIVGLGAFIWWAGRDIVQSSCPNCGNDFQVFKSTLNEDVQLCPYCSQPFSGNKFVRDPVTFSNQSTAFDEAFSDFSPRQKKGKESSKAVVDVEAEVKDAD